MGMNYQIISLVFKIYLYTLYRQNEQITGIFELVEVRVFVSREVVLLRSSCSGRF